MNSNSKASKVHPDSADSAHGADAPDSDPSRWTVLRNLLARVGFPATRPVPREQASPAEDSTFLCNRTVLLEQGGALLARCRGEGTELTLALFDCNDLIEAREVYGTGTTRKLIACIVDNMTLLAGDRGVAGRTGATQFAVLMPMGRANAVRAIESVLGNPTRFESDDGDGEIVLVPDLMVEAVPQTESVERMLSALGRGLARLRDEEILRNRYLKRQRERHSRPMPVQAETGPELPARPVRAPVLGPDPVRSQQIPATIPMPLSNS